MDKDTHYHAHAVLLPVVDLDYLGLITEGDSAMELMMLNAFLRSAADTAGVLRRCCANPAHDDTWHKAAHKLAGSAAQMGALRLHLACEQAEAAKHITREEKQKMIENIECHLAAFKDFFDNRHQAAV